MSTRGRQVQDHGGRSALHQALHGGPAQPGRPARHQAHHPLDRRDGAVDERASHGVERVKRTDRESTIVLFSTNVSDDLKFPL